MIEAVLERAGARAGAADAVMKSDETVTLRRSNDGRSAEWSASEGIHLRVLSEERIGEAAGGSDDPEALVESALESARSGDVVPLILPAPAPVPSVKTSVSETAAAPVEELERILETFDRRLRAVAPEVETWLERSVGRVRVGNTRGVRVDYPVTLAGIGGWARGNSHGVPWQVRVDAVAPALPSLLDVEALAAQLERQLPASAPKEVSGELSAVWFHPRVVRRLLAPLLAALTGVEFTLGRAPLWERRDEPILHRALTLIDDPLAAARPGSRPADDDGVVSARTRLVDQGRLQTGLIDLALGATLGVPSTGHAWRRPSGPPRIGFTNLRLLPGDREPLELIAELPRVLAVADALRYGSPSPRGGRVDLLVSHPMVYQRGEPVGWGERCVVSVDVFDALRGELAVGSDAVWMGAVCVPSVILAEARVRPLPA
jgi:PmbA protein